MLVQTDLSICQGRTTVQGTRIICKDEGWYHGNEEVTFAGQSSAELVAFLGEHLPHSFVDGQDGASQ